MQKIDRLWKLLGVISEAKDEAVKIIASTREAGVAEDDETRGMAIASLHMMQDAADRAGTCVGRMLKKSFNE